MLMALAGQAQAASPTTDLPPLARVQTERAAFAAAYGRDLSLNSPAPTKAEPSGFAPAPTPNWDINAPHLASSSGGAVVGPGLFQQRNTYRGEGFTEGSSPQVTQQPRHMPIPGISLKVPLN